MQFKELGLIHELQRALKDVGYIQPTPIQKKSTPLILSGVDIVIATPGRLLDHVARKTIDLSKIEMLVLDEADRMLDMGFFHDIRKILKLLPRHRQNLLFSATFSDEIKKLASSFWYHQSLLKLCIIISLSIS